ncbi:hypothetical protein KAR91_56365 [Candidatus Pacearchaeota archaeon]|nr:hypothetical protein [Candidatus Pacearchaeota archaeon]
MTVATDREKTGILEDSPTFNIITVEVLVRASNSEITADVGSIQGGSPLIVSVNEISVCANAGDAVTLPLAIAGFSYDVTIINNGANASDVFPALGDDLGAGVNTAASLAAGASITYRSYDDTNWIVV